jgi:hypothetical protein
MANQERLSYILIFSLLAAVLYFSAAGLGQAVSALQLWYGYLLLMLLVLLLLGKTITGSWRGVLIDERNVISLSRFQLLAWTWLILPSYAVAVLWNMQLSGAQAINTIALDPTLWLLMGISTTSLAASPLILNGKKAQTPQTIEMERTFAQLQQQGEQTSSHQGLVVTNQSHRQAKWSDMLTGEETGNAAHLDLSRVQMFFFTLISLLIYAATLNNMFARLTSAPLTMLTELPQLSEGLLALIGISHSGYLAVKALPASQNAAPPASD